ncbi:MAG: arsenite methyltransferase [Dehalococcoidales bacterium]|jgi:SAM-dependent methyltransferase|nr:arsenite S-adenosylmethyltransferase [Dehalococcoidales bacterium]MDP6043648.1 arsenite methyltransferase [Dehalococcoidales bacterium]MDP6577379.1 arsenite methyltransferase [Dehalococcoidales bacterium]MDP6824778.1 arsenite methyltransferase [Dehalococcoidales bacterium]MDP7286026.1 arsenite methyltransferase [Dehalococcoidales bacterium]|tara:strand:+ start:1089 stop:1898 length:810 start_codon:yes stop_codon:yes gene_type:complete
MKEAEIKKIVREGYAERVKTKTSCCGSDNQLQALSKAIGYSDEELGSIPEDANLGLGCGNPIALASLTEGEIVLDLGSGAGFDCFLAANKVGAKGKVIGVDMTLEMLEKARENAEKGGYKNVEFRMGEIENIPAADNSVDVVISNCVINLSPDKPKVFSEAFRVLRPGGRLMVSDIVLLKELPDIIRSSAAAYVGCISGAMMKGEYLKAIKGARFHEVKVLDEAVFPVEFMANDPMAKVTINKMGLAAEAVKEAASSVASIKVQGIKPG